jgi:hypothetical protein
MAIGRTVRTGLLLTSAPTDLGLLLGGPPSGHGNLSAGDKTFCQSSDCLCASSCFLIWAAGIERDGNVLGLHRPSVPSRSFGDLPPERASAIYREALSEMDRYLTEMEIPRRLIEFMTDTSSTSIHWIKMGDMPYTFATPVPSVEEWLARRVDGRSVKRVARRIPHSLS